MATTLKHSELPDDILNGHLSLVVSTRGFMQSRPLRLDGILGKRSATIIKKFHISERPEVRIYCEMNSIHIPDSFVSIDTERTEYIFFL